MVFLLQTPCLAMGLFLVFLALLVLYQANEANSPGVPASIRLKLAPEPGGRL
jgi:hypothetical protein